MARVRAPIGAMPTGEPVGVAPVAPESGEHPAATTAMVPRPPARTSVEIVQTEADLDASVADVHRLKGEGAHALWQLGRKLLDIYTKDMWRARNEDGKPKHKGFAHFVESECGMSRTSAYFWMEVGREFSEDDVRQFGSKNLGAALTVPKEERAGLLQRAKDGDLANTREVKEEAQRIRERAGAQVRKGVGKSGRTAAANAAKAGKPKRPTVTCMVPKGKLALRFGKFGVENDPAKKIGDHPVADLQCVNGVVIRIRLATNGAGEIVGVGEAVRTEDG